MQRHRDGGVSPDGGIAISHKSDANRCGHRGGRILPPRSFSQCRKFGRSALVWLAGKTILEQVWFVLHWRETIPRTLYRRRFAPPRSAAEFQGIERRDCS